MKHREWIQSVLKHEEADAVPFNFAFSPPARRRIEVYYGGSPIEEVLDFPIQMNGLKSTKPLYAARIDYGETVRDEYGVVWAINDLDRGAPIVPCLPEPTLKKYIFPDPNAAYRYEHLANWCLANEDNYRILWVGDLWERATFMRGMEILLMDMVLDPGFVEQLLRGIADFILGVMKNLLTRFQFEGIAVSDDYGTQRAMLISPDEWRKFIRPLLKEIYGLAKQNGRTVMHHTCGNVYPIIGDMIDIGLDVLHPIQPEAMDILKLKRDFGKDLTFCGGVRTQDFLPNATPAEVREEIRRLKREMGAGGGYILEPGITLQADVPLDNMVAMIEEARRS